MLFLPLKKPWLMAVLSALLLWLAWPPFVFSPLLFIAFVPLLLVEDHFHRNDKGNLQFGLSIFLCFFIWNVATTYWVLHASPAGAAAFFINATMMSLPWLLFHRARTLLGDRLAYPALVILWLGFEVLHLRWDLSWPWLTLGNGFALTHNLVQWYEYTGALGGTLWVLVVNILLFKALNRNSKRAFALPFTVLSIPVLLSYLILYISLTHGTYSKVPPPNVVVVQPNIDPYKDKFEGMTPSQQLDRLIALSESKVTPETKLLMWPETAIVEDFAEENAENASSILRIREFLKKYPELSLLAGADTYHFYPGGEKGSVTARKYGNEELYYDMFNTALFLRHGQPVQFYHKSRLVPGVEKMPYPGAFGFLEKFALKLGGTSGSLGSSPEAMVFNSGDFQLTPVICYESVYGAFTAAAVRKGATLLCIVTNDGWWKNTPGYRQHFLYAKLRAIETRRYVARSANTGISGFIDTRGNILSQSQWWVADALSASIPGNTRITCYVRYSEYIDGVISITAILLLALLAWKHIMKKTQKS